MCSCGSCASSSEPSREQSRRPVCGFAHFVSTSGPVMEICCVKPLILRSGFDKTSKKVLDVYAGTRLMVLETRLEKEAKAAAAAAEKAAFEAKILAKRAADAKGR